MIANYGICASCTELIDNSSGIWRDIDGNSFELISSTDGGFVYHRHTPFTDETYTSLGKYANLDSKILDSLAMHGYASDSLGDQATFGFYDLFSEYNAILYSRPDGSVIVTFYNSAETTQFAWGSLEREYAEFDSEDDEPLYDEYAYESIAYEYGDDEYGYESTAYETVAFTDDDEYWGSSESDLP